MYSSVQQEILGVLIPLWSKLELWILWILELWLTCRELRSNLILKRTIQTEVSYRGDLLEIKCLFPLFFLRRVPVSYFFQSFLVFFILVFWGYAMRHAGSSFPNQGLNPCSLPWKCKVLTTRLLEKTSLLPSWASVSLCIKQELYMPQVDSLISEIYVKSFAESLECSKILINYLKIRTKQNNITLVCNCKQN